MKNSEPAEAEIAQTEKIGLGDLVIVALLGVAAFALAGLWAFPSLHPSVWGDAVVAARARPATEVVPGYWTLFASWVYGLLGVGGGTAFLRLLGHLALAGFAVCAYAVLREWLVLAMRHRPQFSRKRTLVMRLASALGASAFVLSDPVWTAGQFFSGTTLLIGLTLGATEMFLVFLRKGTVKYAYLSALLVGLLAAETPMGLVLVPLFVALGAFCTRAKHEDDEPEDDDFFSPETLQVSKWNATFIFLLALVAGIALNCWTYLSHEGVSAVGGSSGDIPLAYLLGYWHRLASASSIGGWILWLGVCLMPLAVSTAKFTDSADEEQFLSYSSGLTFFICALLVLSQTSFVPALWFWTHAPVESQYFLSLGLFCLAATLALALTVLGVDASCRDHRRLAAQAFGERAEEWAAPTGRPVSFLRSTGFVVVPLVVLAVVVPGRLQGTKRIMMGIVGDFVGEVLREAGDARYLFTDGNLDCAIELEAARVGAPLKCYSLMGGGGAMVRHLRTRALQDEEDRFSFNFDAAMGLRSWIRDKPARLKESAALMGFDLWKRDGKALPPMGGLLSRLAGFPDEAERTRGVAAAHALADRVLAVHERSGGAKGCPDERVNKAFYAVQWRLARMCLYRSEDDDLRGRADAATSEAQTAKLLNDRNEVYRDLLAAMERRRSLMMQALTPREGLQLALVRADFMMGKTYAETILGADPDNPDANFAMGMFFLRERQFSRAERHLLRCLIRKPDEPAVYNNLAMVQLEMKKLDAARINVEKALKLIPDSAAVLDTKRAVDAAVEALRGPAKGAPPRP